MGVDTEMEMSLSSSQKKRREKTLERGFFFFLNWLITDLSSDRSLSKPYKLEGGGWKRGRAAGSQSPSLFHFPPTLFERFPRAVTKIILAISIIAIFKWAINVVTKYRQAHWNQSSLIYIVCAASGYMTQCTTWINTDASSGVGVSPAGTVLQPMKQNIWSTMFHIILFNAEWRSKQQHNDMLFFKAAQTSLDLSIEKLWAG